VSKSKLNLILLPFSWIYGIIVGFRNMFFNIELLPSESFDMPVISIGNITVGGTGKTPHAEYLIRLLSGNYQVAVLSRGYKRKSKGFVLANADSKLADLGDEPLQMKKKFSNLVVAVDENRRSGIHQLMDESMKPFVDIVLLDDAFQHRYVSPSISILLIDYSRMLNDDYLLPAGKLREPAGQMKRADIVIVTKCPENLKPIEIRVLTMRIKLQSHQTLYYTSMKYGELKTMVPTPLPTGKVFPQDENFDDIENTVSDQVNFNLSMNMIRNNHMPVLVLTGIASPESLINYVREFSPEVQTLIYPDHHEFGKKEAKKISMTFEKIKSEGGIIITTEKDVMRIQNNSYMERLIPYIYYPDLLIHFLEEEGPAFEQKILDYVRINKRNRRLVKS